MAPGERIKCLLQVVNFQLAIYKDDIYSFFFTKFFLHRFNKQVLVLPSMQDLSTAYASYINREVYEVSIGGQELRCLEVKLNQLSSKFKGLLRL